MPPLKGLPKRHEPQVRRRIRGANLSYVECFGDEAYGIALVNSGCPVALILFSRKGTSRSFATEISGTVAILHLERTPIKPYSCSQATIFVRCRQRLPAHSDARRLQCVRIPSRFAKLSRGHNAQYWVAKLQRKHRARSTPNRGARDLRLDCLISGRPTFSVTQKRLHNKSPRF